MGYIKVNSCFISVFQGRKGNGSPVFSSLVTARNSGLKNPILIEYDEDGGLVIHPSDKKLDDITFKDNSRMYGDLECTIMD